MIEAAQELRDMGISSGIVSMPEKFPVGVTGWQSKPPSLKSWPRYDKEGVCIFTGDIEIVDVDSKHWKESGNFSDLFMEFTKILPFHHKLVCYKTMNNGLQYPYKTSNAEGNQKLAKRLTGPEAIIETRGKGGLAVCPPTEGYEWINADWEDIPTLSADERKQFLSACRDWNQGINIEVTDDVKNYKQNAGKPGDDWAAKNDFIEFLKDHDWAVEKVIDGCVLLRRPGKTSGASASWNYAGLQRFYVWSSSTELPTEKLLKPFAVKAYLEHDGDFKACALALREQGYGNDALALLEACEHCQNWGEVGLILQEHKSKVIKLSLDHWNELSYGLQSFGIKNVSGAKLESFRKGAMVSVEPTSWEEKLTLDEDGKVKGRIFNVDLILTNDEKYKDKFFYDDFAQKISIFNTKTGKFIDFDETYESMLMVHLGREYGDFRRESIQAVVLTLAKHRHFHPLQSKIKSFVWDNVPRVETWLTKYCGVEDSEYSRAVSRKFMVAAIARLFRPGCKVDNVLVLEGPQGTKKSSILRSLCYDNFLDGGLDIRTKDGKMALFGKWIVEFSELEGLNGRSSDEIKAFLAKQDDKLRIPYERGESYYKRTCIFVGTTNKDQYLEDPSGNRRFWPVSIKKADLNKIEEDRDQLWAEAFKMLNDGVKWWVDEESPEAPYFRNAQDDRVIHSDIEDHIRPYLLNAVMDDGRVLVKLHEIWVDVLGGKLSQIDRKKEHEIAECLRRMGLKKGRVSVNGVTRKGWIGTLKGGE